MLVTSLLFNRTFSVFITLFLEDLLYKRILGDGNSVGTEKFLGTCSKIQLIVVSKVLFFIIVRQVWHKNMREFITSQNQATHTM